MDPFRKNTAVDLAKASSILHNDSLLSPTTVTNRPSSNLYSNNTTYSAETEEEMPTAPPAYHTVVDPTMPIPNITSPYDLGSQEEDLDPNSQEASEDTPEITINAATQIRGHGNIISIAQMDSIRIANLISTVLTGDTSTSTSSNNDKTVVDDRPPTPTSPTSATAREETTSTTQVRGVKRYSNINITVNCGATIIGDRNIVGPGLGDIARQMQMAQRNQAQAAMLARQQQQQQQQQQQAAAMGQAQNMASPPAQPSLQGRNMSPNGVLFSGRPVGKVGGNGVATPPMSRSCSLNSEGAVGGRNLKRKGDDGGEGVAAKRRY